MNPTSRISGIALVVLVLASVGAADAAGPDISFKKRASEEKRFVEAVGKAIIKAAHLTARKPALLEYSYTHPKAGRTHLSMKMEFYGATNKRYVANILIKIDTAIKDAWEVLNIDYSDNATIPYSAKRIQALIKELNK